MFARLPLLIASILLLAASSYTYTPAVNSAADGVAGTEDSTITLKWPSGTFQETISYQLAANGSTGISKGALVRVREEDFRPDDLNTTTPWLRTPWIALISCDRNSSGAPTDLDVFTLVRDRGAIAAVLYSNHSAACRINDGYKFGEFDRVIDIFTTKKASTATLIQSQFNSVKYNYTRYNPKLLNDSAAAVNASLALNAHDISPFVIAYLRAGNATVTDDPNDPASPPTPTPVANDNGGRNPSNSLAMIVLYVITGSVSALFLIVILTGAVRAFRHPEQYGPRAYDPNIDGPEGEGQTRALGIARAVLDTFPVIKWGRNYTPSSPRGHTESKMSQAIDDVSCSRSLEGGQGFESAESKPHRRVLDGDSSMITGTVHPSTSSAQRSQGSDVVDPAAIGRETCPICIVDFEEGDDVRVLPCPGHHRFHKDCVDPWLLELSTSCPICREDFQALENMATAQDEDQALVQPEPEPAGTSTYPPHQHPTASWFAKYMHFAQRKRSRGHRPPSETSLSQ